MYLLKSIQNVNKTAARFFNYRVVIRWKSAASRRISSQASAITAPLAPTQGNGRHVSLQPAAGTPGRTAQRAKRPASRKFANRNATAELSALSWAWPAGSGFLNSYKAKLMLTQ